MAVGTYLETVENLAARLQDPKIRIIDCRFELMDPGAGRRSYGAGHIPGAVYADLDKDLAGPVGPGTGRHPLPDPDRLAHTFAHMGIGNDSRVVVYDDGAGALAARTWWLLRWLGHVNAAVLDGGFAAWIEAGYPTETGAPVVVQGDFTAEPQAGMVLETSEILDARDNMDELLLIDARAATRFTGAEETIDAMAGHIPGTRNLPFSENVEASGRWRSPAEIRSRLAPVLGEPCGQSWAVMCGSGVTACHLVIAGLLAGYAEPRVYVGSWSEWIADSARPIETGSG